MPASRNELIRLLERLQIPISKAFLEAVSRITSRAQIRRLITLLETATGFGDIGPALAASGLRAGSWALLTESIRSAYLESGIFTTSADVPKRFQAEFNLLNPRAEAWLRTHSSQLITVLTNEQLGAIRVVLQEGMRAGRNPRDIALDIVGRISKQTGRRSGGIIGLNVPQTTAVVNARADLQTLSPRYFTRIRRDSRFDFIVRGAMQAGTPLPRATVDKLVGRYADRLLKTRGDAVGRTEALKALNEAADESLRQIIEEGYAKPEAVKRIWRHSFALNERPGHLKMDGQERGMEESFNNPVTGAVLQRPGTGGAAEDIHCRCMLEHKIDFVAVELFNG